MAGSCLGLGLPALLFRAWSRARGNRVMRAVVQRVSRARVLIAGDVAGEIGTGLLVLLGVTHDDTADRARWLAEKIVGLRIFNDADGKMNRDLMEVNGGVLVVSQFTLY